MKASVLCALAALALHLTAFGGSPTDPLLPIYVDPVNGSDDNNGYTWETAMKPIAAANAKTESWDYYDKRRCQIVLKKGTYVLTEALTLKPRTSITGEPGADRTETVLTAPEGTTNVNFISFGSINGSFNQTLANLTISNVTMKGNATVYCSSGSTRDACILTNVLMTCCRQTNGTAISAAGLYAASSLLAVDCEFAGLTNTTAYGSVAICRGGGRFVNCLIRDCYNNGNGQIRAWVGPYDKLSDTRYLVENCVFTNNVAGGTAGCIYNVPVIVDSLFVDNSAVHSASAIACPTDSKWGFYTNHDAKVVGCTFRRNRVSTGTNYEGGTVSFANNGIVSNCTFEGNSSSGWCSCVYNAQEIRDCTFVTNVAERAPSFGACYFHDATYAKADPVVSGCTFSGNDSPGSLSCGAAIYFNVPGLVENCLFTNNAAARYGGSVVVNDNVSGVVVSNSTFVGNRALSGGAVYGVSNVVDCTFADNVATSNGGAFHSGTMKGAMISNCVFRGNGAASRGGGVYFTQYAQLNNALVTDCVFTNNMAGGTGDYMGGAGLYAWVEGGTAPTALTVRNSLFAGNVLTNTTGAGCGSAVILMVRSKDNLEHIIMENCTIVGNRSMYGSRAAVYVWPDNTTYGYGPTFFTNTLIACNLDADGAYTPRSYDSVYEISTSMAKKMGYCVIHPKLMLRTTTIAFDADQHVTSTDTLPTFRPGTFVPSRGNPAFNAGFPLPWMTGAFDLQRDAEGKPFAPRIGRGAVDIGAYENTPSGLGMMMMVR